MDHFTHYAQAYATRNKSAKRHTKSKEVCTRAKQRYDRLVRSSVLLPGDRVLVRNSSERGGPGKLRSHWENPFHIVVSRKGEDSPVYEVKPEVGTGGNRILHRNLLLPCTYLSIDIPSQVTRKSRRISLAMLNRHLRHWWKTCQMGPIAMMSIRLPQCIPTLDRT